MSNFSNVLVCVLFDRKEEGSHYSVPAHESPGTERSFSVGCSKPCPCTYALCRRFYWIFSCLWESKRKKEKGEGESESERSERTRYKRNLDWEHAALVNVVE